MGSTLDESRKHQAFREPWIAYLLGGAYLLLCLYEFNTSTEMTARQNWFSIQQDIRCYGASITAFLLCVGLPRLVCYERERGTDSLIRTAQRGSFDTWRDKTLYTVLYCGAVVFALGAVDLLVHAGTFRFEGALSPIEPDWCVYFRSESLPPMSNLAYCVLQYVFLYLGALYFAGFVLLVAALTKRAAVTIFLCGASYLACMVYKAVGYRVGHAVAPALRTLYRFGFGGYLLHDSFSWTADINHSIGEWADVWKPVLLAAVMVALEFTALWLLWRRKARR